MSQSHTSVVIYHKSCMDGAGAALAAWLALGDSAKYWYAAYGDALIADEEVRDRDVFILDFSYPRVALDHLRTVARSVTILDHHLTTEQELRDFPGATFDLEKSGAVMAWEHFHTMAGAIGGHRPMPKLFAYIQDRDLWRWQLPHSHAISAYLGSLGAFRDFRLLIPFARDDEWIENAIVEGGAILRYQEQNVESAARNAVVRKIGEHPFYVMNATMLVSEIGHALCHKMSRETNTSNGRAALWRWSDARNAYVVSLRGHGDVDVAATAKQLGGGGHRYAAGFECKRLPWL